MRQNVVSLFLHQWSALELESVSTLILGAPEFILPGHVFVTRRGSEAQRHTSVSGAASGF
ncbi:MAG: hypothetical protein ACLVJ6_05770 [Merdibacter sp.]